MCVRCQKNELAKRWSEGETELFTYCAIAGHRPEGVFCQITLIDTSPDVVLNDVEPLLTNESDGRKKASCYSAPVHVWKGTHRIAPSHGQMTEDLAQQFVDVQSTLHGRHRWESGGKASWRTICVQSWSYIRVPVAGRTVAISSGPSCWGKVGFVRHFARRN